MSRPPLFLIARTTPELGMERVAHRLIVDLNRSNRVEAAGVCGTAWADVPMTSLGGLVTGPHRLIAMWWRLWRARELFRNRTVVLAGVWLAVVFLSVPGTRARAVVWEHSLIREKRQSSRKLRILAALATRLYRRAAVIVCVSAPLADEIEKLTGHQNVIQIANAAGDEAFAPAELAKLTRGRRGRRYATVGALRGTKNQAEVIRAVSAMPDATLMVIGEGPDKRKLAELARELDVLDRVAFAGHVSGNSLPEYLAQTDVLVHPSHGETFGMVYFEAAQQGVPVVSKAHSISTWCIPRFVPGVIYGGGVEELRTTLEQLNPNLVAGFVASAFVERRALLDRREITRAWQRLLGPE